MANDTEHDGSGTTLDQSKVISQESFTMPRRNRNIVHETQPVPTAPEKAILRQKQIDGRFIPMTDLPSQFRFYEFDILHVRRFNLNDLNRLHVARQSKSMRVLIDTIDNCIDQSAYDLTVGDFFFLLFWFRFNSFKKTKLSIRTMCTDKTHMERVKMTEDALRNKLPTLADGSDIEYLDEEHTKPRWSKESLIIQQMVTNTDLEIKNPDPLIHELVDAIAETYNVLPYPKTIKAHLEESEKYADVFESLARDTLNAQDAMVTANDIMAQDWIFTYACLLSTEHGATVQERAAWLLQQSESGAIDNDITTDLDEFKEKSGHGVSEFVKVKCAGCGAQHNRKIDADALTFFS